MSEPFCILCGAQHSFGTQCDPERLAWVQRRRVVAAPEAEEVEEKIIRWRAVVTYRREAGPTTVEYPLEEIGDLHYLIERGPHWDCIVSIVINIIPMIENLTVEAAEKL